VAEPVKNYSEFFVRLVTVLRESPTANPGTGKGLKIVPFLSKVYEQQYGLDLKKEVVDAKFKNLLEALQLCPEVELLEKNVYIRLKYGNSIKKYLPKEKATEMSDFHFEVVGQLLEKDKEVDFLPPDEPLVPTFYPSELWCGERIGYYFGSTLAGLGYHRDPRQSHVPVFEPLESKEPPPTLKINLRREDKDDDWGFTLQDDLVITEIEPDSSAEIFGLMEGWKIVMVDGEVVTKKEQVKPKKPLEMSLLVMEPPKPKEVPKPMEPEEKKAMNKNWTKIADEPDEYDPDMPIGNQDPPALKEDGSIDWSVFLSEVTPELAREDYKPPAAWASEEAEKEAWKEWQEKKDAEDAARKKRVEEARRRHAEKNRVAMLKRNLELGLDEDGMEIKRPRAESV